MPEFDIFEGLPVNIPRPVASTIRTIQSAVRRNVEHPYIIIEHVDPDIVEKLANERRPTFLKLARLFYNADLRKLIVKVVSNFHEFAAESFHDVFIAHLIRSGLQREVDSGGAGQVKDSEYAKEPDKSYYPRRQVPNRDAKWPTMILEVGYSETVSRLRVDCRWWLGRSEGQVKIALLLSIDRNRPHISMEKWENRPATHSYRLRARQSSPQKTATFTVTLNNDQYVVAEAPLSLPIDEIVMPSVSGTVPTLQISGDDFKEVATVIWRNQGFVQRPT